jgi:hypothetical protein
LDTLEPLTRTDALHSEYPKVIAQSDLVSFVVAFSCKPSPNIKSGGFVESAADSVNTFLPVFDDYAAHLCARLHAVTVISTSQEHLLCEVHDGVRACGTGAPVLSTMCTGSLAVVGMHIDCIAGTGDAGSYANVVNLEFFFSVLKISATTLSCRCPTVDTHKKIPGYKLHRLVQSVMQCDA